MSEATEAWLEVNIEPNEAFDRDLLFSVVEPLVHQHLGDYVKCWFFFWEPGPELRLRLRWKDPSRHAELSERVFALLERRRVDGRFTSWYEGSHGRRGEHYTGEAEAYGREEWQLQQKDWMSGSELAILLLRLDRDGRFSGSETNTLEGHWSRRVHLFTNQTFGSWHAEIVLCLLQARGYLAHVIQSPDAGSVYKETFRRVDEALRLVSSDMQ